MPARNGSAIPREVDLAIAVVCAILPRGCCLSLEEIEELTGLKYKTAHAIEARAMDKLRRKPSVRRLFNDHCDD